jgi:hypothetical protein
MFVGENKLLGTWKLKSFIFEMPTGERFNLFGEHPNGYLGYSPDGRMYAILVADNRIKPHDVAPTDGERVKLHETMSAYSGTYTLDSEKVVHHVDISWNEAWTGTDQVRFYSVDGDVLTIKQVLYKSPADGREGQAVIVWEKVKTPPR